VAPDFRENQISNLASFNRFYRSYRSIDACPLESTVILLFGTLTPSTRSMTLLLPSRSTTEISFGSPGSGKIKSQTLTFFFYWSSRSRTHAFLEFLRLTPGLWASGVLKVKHEKPRGGKTLEAKDLLPCASTLRDFGRLWAFRTLGGTVAKINNSLLILRSMVHDCFGSSGFVSSKVLCTSHLKLPKLISPNAWIDCHLSPSRSTTHAYFKVFP
jgi:hypothetical protein